MLCATEVLTISRSSIPAPAFGYRYSVMRLEITYLWSTRCFNVIRIKFLKLLREKAMKKFYVGLMAGVMVAASAHAADEPVVIGDVTMPAVESSAAFQQVEKKLGKWEGKMTQGLTGAVIDVSYEWRLTSGGNTITETLVEDGVEMLTTYSDDNGELVVKHYCALGTQPVFSVSSVSDTELALALDESANDLHAEHESFVTAMKWTMQGDDGNSMLFTNTIMLDGQLTENSALLTRVD